MALGRAWSNMPGGDAPCGPSDGPTADDRRARQAVPARPALRLRKLCAAAPPVASVDPRRVSAPNTPSVGPGMPAASTPASKGNSKAKSLELTEVLLDAHDHRIRSHQVFDASLAKADLAHPPLAIRACIIESARRFDKHVQAHEQSE